jgi:UDP-3-O-[3-hydroxymyristoyl] glucosamine N-acyltransferase
MTTAKAREITLGELTERIGGRLDGPADKLIRGANALAEAKQDEVAFLANVRYERFMADTSAGAVIVAADYDGPGESLIRCQDPYFAFREAMVVLYGFRVHPFAGIDPQARIDPSAKLGQNVSVAQFVTVGPDVHIGDGSVLYPGVFVGPSCRIGRDCILYPNVVIYDHTVLGDRVSVHACTVIGEDGFGYATHAGRHEKIPQAGWVEIADDVEIGACCALDRAAVGATVIGPGTKFSNLVAIGHGAKVGRACLFVAQAGIAGSTTIGDYCAFAGQSGVVGHLNIGSRVRVGAQAGVTRDIPEGQEVLGSPAIPLSLCRRVFTVTPQLPELRRQLKKLQAEVEGLKARLGEDEGPS